MTLSGNGSAQTYQDLHNFSCCNGPELLAQGVGYKVSPSGAFNVITRSIPGGSRAPLIQAKDGNFYGVTSNGGTHDQGTVFGMSPSGTVKVLYSFDETHGCQPEGPLAAYMGPLLDAVLLG